MHTPRHDTLLHQNVQFTGTHTRRHDTLTRCTRRHCTWAHRPDTHVLTQNDTHLHSGRHDAQAHTRRHVVHTKRLFTATHSKHPELINSCISLYHVSCRIEACNMNSFVCISVLSLLVQAIVYQVSSCASANHVYVCLCFMSPCLCTCIISPCLCMCNMSPCLCMCIMSP